MIPYQLEMVLVRYNRNIVLNPMTGTLITELERFPNRSDFQIAYTELTLLYRST